MVKIKRKKRFAYGGKDLDYDLSDQNLESPYDAATIPYGGVQSSGVGEILSAIPDPMTQAVGSGMQLGMKIGDTVGNMIGGQDGENVAGMIKGTIDKTSIVMNKDLSVTDRIIGSVIPFYGGYKSAKAARAKRREQERIAKEKATKQQNAAIAKIDNPVFNDYAGGSGKGFNTTSLYDDGGKTNTPVKSESDDESNLVKASSLRVETDTTTPTDYNTLKLELQKMGLKDYRDVMNADEQTAMKIRSLVRKQVLSNPSMFKSHLSDKDGIKNSINFNTLIPAILPVDKTYGMAGSSGVTETERPKFVLPSTFRDGGKAPSMEEPIGGMAVPVASNARIALGKTHEEGGIKIASDTEVEHGETLLENNTGGLDVFSSKLGTANIANPLVIQKGQLEQQASSLASQLNTKLSRLDKATDKFQKNGIQREIEGNKIKLDAIQTQIKAIDTQLSQLFKEQEMSQGRPENVDSSVMATGGTKQHWDGNKTGLITGISNRNSLLLDNTIIPYSAKTGVKKVKSKQGLVNITPRTISLPDKTSTSTNKPNKTLGMSMGKALDVAQSLSPFLENINNIALNKKLKKMKVPAPILNKAAILDDNIDTSASMSGVTSAVNKVEDFIKGNTSNSNVARNNISMAVLTGEKDKEAIREKKHNEQVAIRNANKSNAQQVESNNNAKMDNYNQQVFQKNIQTTITNPSQNMANFTDKMNTIISNKRLDKYQEKQLALNMMLAPEGVANDMMPIAKDMSKSDYVKYLKSKGAKQDYIDKQIQYVSSVYKFKPE